MRRQQRILHGALKIGLSGLALWCITASAAHAGLEPLIPTLSVTGGTGVPGGTVSVTLALGDDVENAGVSAGVDLRFDADKLAFSDFAASCKLSDRLASTHQIAGRLIGTNLLNVEIAIQVGPPPPPVLGDGDLATCDFTIREGVETGTTALEIESPFLGNAEGGDIPVDVTDGFVTIVEVLPTATPTVTATPVNTNTPTVTATKVVTGTSTATATDTPATPATPTATFTAPPTNTSAPGTSTATATATNTAVQMTATATATVTRTGGTGSTPTRTPNKGGDGGGCNVVPTQGVDNAGAAGLLLLPALLLWVRRRR